MSTVLITGITGFLGKKLAFKLLAQGHSVVGIANSEHGIVEFRRTIDSNKIKIYTLDIADCYYPLTRILKDHNVDYVIHAAANKHVGICEKNPLRTIDVNIIGSKNVMLASLNSNVKNVIGISTDKAINPTCTYGMSKKLMEEMYLENNCGIFQGVNFLFSSGSVLDIWDKLIIENKQLLVNTEASRYFSEIDDVCDKIIQSLDVKTRFTIDHCYLISIQMLQLAFSKYKNYWNVNSYTPLQVEKINENLPFGITTIIEPNESKIIELIDAHYKKSTI